MMTRSEIFRMTEHLATLGRRLLGYVAWAYGICALLALGYCVATSDLEPEPDKDIKSIRIKGTDVTLHIPSNYLDWPRPIGSSTETDGVLMIVTMPDIEGVTRTNRHIFKYPDRYGTIHIAKNNLNIGELYKIYGREEDRNVENETITMEFELIKTITSPISITNTIFPYEIYKNIKDDDYFFIICERSYNNSKTLGGFCNFYYIFNGLTVNFTFNRKYMPQWRRIETQVKNLVEGKDVSSVAGGWKK